MWARGSHSFKTGFDVQLDNIRHMSSGNVAGSYVFQTLAGFATRVPSGAGESYTQAFAGSGRDGVTTHPDARAYALFLQDKWRVSEALTVDAGVRYDVHELPRPGSAIRIHNWRRPASTPAR